MSYNEYSPLDTTLPFFSNQILQDISTHPTRAKLIIPFLLQFKAVARRVKVSVQTNNAGNSVDVFFNGDLENPTRIGPGGNQTFNRWIRTIRVASLSGTAHPVLVEYDAVPVQYLPPRQRRAL